MQKKKSSGLKEHLVDLEIKVEAFQSVNLSLITIQITSEP